MTNGKNYTEQITKVVPLLSIIFVFYGVFYLFFFYQYFNFNLLPFLEFTELLPLTLFEFIIIASGIIVVTFFTFILSLLFRKKAFQFYSPIIILLIGIVGIVLYCISEKYGSYSINRGLFVLQLTVLISSLMIFIFYKFSDRLRNNQIITLTFFIVLIIVGNAKARAYDKACDVKDNNLYFGSYITIEKEDTASYKSKHIANYIDSVNSNHPQIFKRIIKISSGHKYLFIGKCKNDYIFYNSLTNGVDLYPVSSVVQAYIYSK